MQKATLLSPLYLWEMASITESATNAAAMAFVCQLSREYSFVTMHLNVYSVNAFLKINQIFFVFSIIMFSLSLKMI